MGRSPDFGVMNWLRARLADVLNEAVVNLQGDTLQTAVVYTRIHAIVFIIFLKFFFYLFIYFFKFFFNF